MLQTPRFRPHFQPVVIEPDQLFLISEVQTVLLSGTLYCALAPYLNGEYSTAAIMQALQPHFHADRVQFALLSLEKQGYVVEAQAQLIPILSPLLTLSPATAQYRLQSCKLSIQSISDSSLDHWVHQLTSSLIAEGVTVSETDADLTVILTDSYHYPALEAFNQRAIPSQKPWILCKLSGSTLWFGPLFQPHVTGCWMCLVQRLRCNQPVEHYIQSQTQQRIRPPMLTSPAHQVMGIGILTHLLLQWVVQPEPCVLQGHLITFNPSTLSSQSHQLIKRPQCRACGDPQLWDPSRAPRPIKLINQSKQSEEGGYRTVTPEITFNRYRHHLDPLLGIVRDLRRISPPHDPDNHTYIATHAFGIPRNTQYLRRAIQGQASGKGSSDQQARVSGLCEAIERYSGLFQGDEIQYRSTYRGLGDLAIHPNSVMLFSERQYQRRNESDPMGAREDVPEPLELDAEIDWTPIWSITEEQFKWIPTAYVYYEHPDRRYCLPDSNGAAAGNTLEEAILQGFLEVVERDCIAIWWYNRLRRPAVDWRAVADPYLQTVASRLSDQQMWILNITHDLNIPTFVAVAPVGSLDEPLVCGFGTHWDPVIALRRAVTELNQLRIVPTRSGVKVPWEHVTVSSCPYLLPLDVDPSQVEELGCGVNPDLKVMVLNCVELARQHGLDVLVLDQTRPDVELPVVKVVVPGLRPHWPRYAAGRLYTIPVSLGWQDAATSEAQFNSIPFVY